MKLLHLIIGAVLAVPAFGQSVIDDSFGAQGTGGAGFYQVANQSSAPSNPSSAVRFYANNSNKFVLLNASGASAVLGAADLSLTGGSAFTDTGLNVGTNPASAGIIRIPNAAVVRARNAANTDDLAIVETDVSNRVVIGNSSGVTVRVRASGLAGWDFNTNGHFAPVTDNAFDVGGSSNGVRKLYFGAGTTNAGGIAWTDVNIFRSGTGLLQFSALLGIGVSPDQPLSVASNTIGARQIQHSYYADDGSGPTFITRKSRNATIGSHTIVQSTDRLGSWTSQGSDGSAFVAGATIAMEVDGTPGSNDMPGRIVFFTTADGGSSPTERLRISSNGNVSVVTGELQTAGNRVNYNLAAYGAGTAYAFTNTAAAIDFGTTDPVIVLDKAGTYRINAQVHIAYNAATVVAETATIKVRRTNNTAADLSQVVVIDLPASTTLTHTYLLAEIPPFYYTTSATDDSVTIFANVSAALGAGTIDATAIGTSITAERMY